MSTIRFVVPSAQAIQTQFRSLIFGTRPHCPVCHRTNVRRSGERYHCRRCRRKFSLISGTWLNGMKLSWAQLWILLWCFCQRYPPAHAASQADVTIRIARSWYDRFRIHLPARARKLHLLVCADEAYIGKRKTGNQRIVAGAVEPQTDELRLQIIPDTEQGSIETFLWTHVDPVTLVRSDAHPSYGQIEWMGYGHEIDVHDRGQLAKTVPIERVWSFTKWHIRRMYHHIHGRRLPLFLREVEWRFSARETFASPEALATILLRPVPTRD